MISTMDALQWVQHLFSVMSEEGFASSCRNQRQCTGVYRVNFDRESPRHAIAREMISL